MQWSRCFLGGCKSRIEMPFAWKWGFRSFDKFQIDQADPRRYQIPLWSVRILHCESLQQIREIWARQGGVTWTKPLHLERVLHEQANTIRCTCHEYYFWSVLLHRCARIPHDLRLVRTRFRVFVQAACVGEQRITQGIFPALRQQIYLWCDLLRWVI